jgi:hypothetical protein
MPESTFELVHDGPASTVYLKSIKQDNQTWDNVYAVKSAPLSKRYSPEPHDIVKEARLLQVAAGHPCVRDSSVFDFMG